MNLYREHETPGLSPLEEYLERKRREFIGISGAEIGARDYEWLASDVDRLAERIRDRVIETDRASECFLVVGRVQSGKTGHQLGMLSWAAEHCDLAVFFTGVTEALNGQTSARINRDVRSLPSSPVNVLKVPTRASVERNTSAYTQISARVAARRSHMAGTSRWPEPLPVLTSMKTVPRVSALTWLFQELQDVHGDDLVVLFIDDEADQASPNALAAKGEEAATYSELKELRESVARHAWLSYTATPQAIFLTEAQGALRPDYCVFTHPGTDYFGVEDLLGGRSAGGRVPISDFDQARIGPSWYPASLKRAVTDFLCTAWARQYAPGDFYAGSFTQADPDARMRSVQMLVHTDSKVASHRADYECLDGLLRELLDEIDEALDAQVVPDDLATSWRSMHSRVSTLQPPSFDAAMSQEALHQVGVLLSRVFLRVVNSDKNAPGTEDGELPTGSADWERHALWIVIGGDILGRGLTLPQLTAMYFTRDPNSPNEDTVAQQMRFAGYRKPYEHMFRLHAPTTVFDAFEDISVAESVFVARVEAWDQADRNLKDSAPDLWYVTRPGSRVRPTRLSVRDRALVDSNFQRQIFSARAIFSPRCLVDNSEVLERWLDGATVVDQGDSWFRVACAADDLAWLMERFVFSGKDDRMRDVALELLSPGLRELGLSDMAGAVMVRNRSVADGARKGVLPDLAAIEVHRRIGGSVDPIAAARSWSKGLAPKSGLRASEWFDEATLAVQHVGQSQRDAADSLPFEAVTLIVEPVVGQVDGVDVAAGLGISMLAPDGYSVRAIGVSSA